METVGIRNGNGYIWTISKEYQNLVYCDLATISTHNQTVHQVSSTSFNKNCKKSYPETWTFLKTYNSIKIKCTDTLKTYALYLLIV